MPKPLPCITLNETAHGREVIGSGGHPDPNPTRRPLSSPATSLPLQHLPHRLCGGAAPHRESYPPLHRDSPRAPPQLPPPWERRRAKPVAWRWWRLTSAHAWLMAAAARLRLCGRHCCGERRLEVLAMEAGQGEATVPV
jgi:hypothetical protein